MAISQAAREKKVHKLKTAEDVYDIVEFIRGTSDINGSEWSMLDFRNLCRRRPERSDPHWIEILSNELLGELADAKLVIFPPTHARGRKNLDRSGVSFAIKQRDSNMTDIHTDGPAPEWPAYDWAGRWTPTDTKFRRRILQDKYEPDTLLDREFVSFLNPHFAASEHDLSAELADNQATNWITGLICPQSRGCLAEQQKKSTDQPLVRELRSITYELVSNLKYAFIRQTNGAENISASRQRSYVQLYTTRGGTKSYDRLHFIVADLGHGIVRTIEPKLRANLEYPPSSPKQIIQDLLMGQLPDYGRSSGDGYKKIVDIVRQHRGDLYLTTGSSSPTGDINVVRAVLRHQANSTEKLTVDTDTRLGFMGTTAHVVIPLTMSTSKKADSSQD